MSAFDKIIGYEAIKKELVQLVDMIHNREIYEKLGAKLPQGLLLYGEPGLGKSLMANSFIEASGLVSYTVRRNKGTDNFVGEISDTFKLAKENAPSIIFLDDMDKFANEDCYHRDAPEYVAIQSGIDEVKDASVFVIATANDIDKLPRSLTRAGRFDRKIEVCVPSPEDAKEIVKYYLQDKNLSEEVNLDDIAAMINYNSCATLEAVLNTATVKAAYARRDCITLEDFIDAVIKMEYEAPDKSVKPSSEKLERMALHEAGHIVVSEVLYENCVGFASLRVTGRDSKGGFVKRCVDIESDVYQVLIALGGKAAVELHYADGCDIGASGDIETAVKYIRSGISETGVNGLGFIDLETDRSPSMSENMNIRCEAAVYAELERYMAKAKEILMKNRDFLKKTTNALLKKQTLVKSDIKALRDSVEIIKVAV